ncbi:hypothetical protein M0R45_019608 [Rubus argutus]|uniref:Uncharacterized protein n=1 Tax=Rubus argutus TaxID=59490 RepID=A0AAW1X8M3_RUBAR
MAFTTTVSLVVHNSLKGFMDHQVMKKPVTKSSVEAWVIKFRKGLKTLNKNLTMGSEDKEVSAELLAVINREDVLDNVVFNKGEDLGMKIQLLK